MSAFVGANKPSDQASYLTKLFYDPKSGLTSAAKLYQKVKSKGYTMKQVREFVAKQEVSQIHQRPKKPKYFPIFSQHDSVWQTDLIFYPQTSKINNGYSVILLAIELTTRRCIAVPMKNKTEKESLRAGRAFLKEASRWRKPVKVTSDLGSEFYSKGWARLMTQHKIVHAMVEEGDHTILGLINRLCRTIKGLITKYFDTYATKKWIDALPDLVHNYNTTVHASIKCSPLQAERSAEIRERIRREASDQTNFVVATKEDFGEGDKVRKLKRGALFGKEGAKWTKGTYTIDGRANNVSSYGLDDKGDKNLKHHELKRVPTDTQTNPFKRDTSKSFDVVEHLAKVRHTKKGVNLPKGAPKTRKTAAPKAQVLNISDRKSKDYAGQAQPAVRAPKPRKQRKAVVRKPKGSNIYEVEKIIRETSSKGRKLFQVRWKGYDPSQDTLEPEKNIPASLVAEFRRSQATSESTALLKKRATAARKQLRGKTFKDDGVTWKVGDAKFDSEYNCVMVYYFDVGAHPKRAPPIDDMEYSPLKEVEQLMNQKVRRKRRA